MLLDEIEKAHPDVFNVLLQVMDDGRLTDGQGRTVDFTNVVLIMTSNLATDPASFFRPEFINRIDDIVRFRSLTAEDLVPIVDIQLARVRQRLAERRITLQVTDAAKRPRRRTRLRPGVRCSPHQTGDPAPHRRPAGLADPRRQIRRGRHRHHRCRRQRVDLRLKAAQPS